MKNSLRSLFRYFLYWMILFSVERLTFFIFHFEKLRNAPASDQAMLFLKGLRLDLSMCGYILLLPVVLLLPLLVSRSLSRFFDTLLSIYTIIIACIVVIFGVVDLNIYTEWGNKINSRALEFFFLSPGEAIASSATSPVLLSFSLIGGKIALYTWSYYRFFRFHYEYPSRFYHLLLAFPVLAFGIVMMVRGGLQLAPINQSAVYFSSSTPVNHAALNTEWNLMHSVIENHFSNENPYIFMPPEIARHKTDSLYNAVQTGISENVLTTTRPNVVMIILESFTSDVVEAFGGEPGVSPEISRLAKEGIAFTNIYASGDRTDKGMIALLSAFPTQAIRTIIQQPDKFEKLPSLPKIFSDQGYETAFYYGGESEFSNFKSYLLSAGIRKITDRRDFDPAQMNSKWGAHDGFLFDKALRQISAQKAPFFSIVLTLSSHEPFEIPEASPYMGADLPSLFRQAAHYTDACVGRFIEQAKKQEWYSNTLFIIVADHGHRLPKEYSSAYEPGKFRIPLIFYGDVLKKEFRGSEQKKTGSQTDLAATLLSQLNIPDTSFRWSADLLNRNAPGFAFYSYDNGIGWADGAQVITVDNVTGKLSSAKGQGSDSSNEKRILLSKAYMQEVFRQYLEY